MSDDIGSALAVGIEQYDKPSELAAQEPDKARREAKRWIKEIESTSARTKPWRERCEAILKRYRDERDNTVTLPGLAASRKRRYNIYWSMVQTEKPHLFMENPVPYVHREFLDEDGPARDASELIYRGLTCMVDQSSTYDSFSAAVDDYQHTSRGTTWVRYTPFFKLRPSVERFPLVPGEEPSGAPHGYEVEDGTDEMGMPQQFYRPNVEFKAYEKAEVSHVLWKDFLHEMCGSWEHVGWIARKVPMTYQQLKKRFGKELAAKIKMKRDAERNAHENKNQSDDFKQLYSRAEIWEIWDRHKREVIWICTDYEDHVLDKKEDIYGLENFYPCAKPIFGTLTSDSLQPVPAYALYQELLNELDEITQRIKLLTQAMRIVGAYDANQHDLVRIVKQTSENDLVPVTNWGMFAERGGLKGAIDFVPIGDVAAVLEKLHTHRRILTQELYEVSGISDVIRGASDYRETAEAQKIKGDFGTMRLRLKQREVAEHARETLQILAEIFSKHYSDDFIKTITNAENLFLREEQRPKQLTPQEQQQLQQQAQQTGKPVEVPTETFKVFDEERFKAALEILRSDEMRMYRVKIDTETLGGMKREQMQQERGEFLQGISQFLQPAMQIAQDMPNFAPAMAALIEHGVRGSGAGRMVEKKIFDALDKVMREGSGKEPEPPPGKTPQELELEKAKLQLEQQRLQLEMQKFQAGAQRDMGLLQEKHQRLQVDAQGRERDAQARHMKTMLDAQAKEKQIEAQREASWLNAEAAKSAQKLQAAKIEIEAEKAGADRDERYDKMAMDTEDKDVGRAYEWQKKQDELAHDSDERAKDRAAASRDRTSNSSE